MNVNEQT